MGAHSETIKLLYKLEKENGIVKSEIKKARLTLELQENCREFLENIPRVIETRTSCQQDSVWSHGKHCQGN
jgi:hypothetical protein